MPFLFLKYKEEKEKFISYNNIDNYNFLVKEGYLNYLIYYFNFKLILCSIYNLEINKEYLKEHLSKYLSNFKSKEKINKAINLYSLLNSLKLVSLFNSLDLITNFIEFKS